MSFPPNSFQELFPQFPQTPVSSVAPTLSLYPQLFLCTSDHILLQNPPLTHTREGMHPYSYDGCDSDSPVSDPSSGSDSEASSTQPQLTLVILLDDDDDDDEGEEQVHPLSSYRPKRPLPRNFGGSHKSQVKQETPQGTVVSFPEVYHTINCIPGLRDKSLEVRLSLGAAVGYSKLCFRSFGWNVINRVRSQQKSHQSQ